MKAEKRKKANRQKLQQRLRELFQFDHAELDFGIYRLLNARRQEIERFIERDLLEAVEEGLAPFLAADRREIEAQLAEKRAQLGAAALDETGAVRETFRDMPLAQDYSALRAELRKLSVAEETEARVFADLEAFFFRYYDEGDFLSRRRYSSRGHAYCVPYDGQEVLLHWANRDQYYVKSAERFTDYCFRVDGYGVHFKLERAELPPDNVKGDKRYFVPQQDRPPAYDPQRRTLTLHFAYRPLGEAEEAAWLARYNQAQPKSGRRRTLDRSLLCAAVESALLEQLAGLDAPGLRPRLAAPAPGQERSLLGLHLERYTARHTMDYFVHKDLGGFLRRELDVYLKTEVLRVDDFAGDDSAESLRLALTRLRLERRVAGAVAFLCTQPLLSPAARAFAALRRRAAPPPLPALRGGEGALTGVEI